MICAGEIPGTQILESPDLSAAPTLHKHPEDQQSFPAPGSQHLEACYSIGFALNVGPSARTIEQVEQVYHGGHIGAIRCAT